MEQFYILIFIIALTIGMLWNYFKLKRISARNINSNHSLRKIPFQLKWKHFFLPTVLIIMGLIGEVSYFFIQLGVAIFILELVDWFLNGKFVYDTYIIWGDSLIENGFNSNEYNLLELTAISFQPFADALKLKFKYGQTLSIPRADFKKDDLNNFIKIAIEKSESEVAISEDAMNKIYVVGY